MSPIKRGYLKEYKNKLQTPGTTISYNLHDKMCFCINGPDCRITVNFTNAPIAYDNSDEFYEQGDNGEYILV
tara:strand:- start:1842 stop:2057 length:216 start_codon:yes stop_codon:yes gene_type:complete